MDTMEHLWTTQKVANYLEIPVPTLYRWRQTNYGPPACRVGKHLRFRPADVMAWVDKQLEQRETDDRPAA